MADTISPGGADRLDPYKNFKFIVSWDGKPVAGISKVGGLTRTTQVVSHREGGDPSLARKSPGQTDYGPITLERGVTHDPEFETWANKVWSLGNAVLIQSLTLQHEGWQRDPGVAEPGEPSF